MNSSSSIQVAGIESIANSAEHKQALARLSVIFHAELGTLDGNEADHLIKLIEQYESKVYPMD